MINTDIKDKLGKLQNLLNNEKNGNEEKIKGIIKEVVPTYKNKSNK